jgi:hypothetical protein
MTSRSPTQGTSRQSRPGPASEELAVSSLALLQELEASLEQSQRALLKRDLAGIEQGTREQIGLQQALAALWASAAPAVPAVPEDQRAADPAISFGPLSFGLRESNLAPTVLAAQRRVLHLGRVQAAVLSRARQSLKMIFYLAAGPQTTYGPPTAGAIGAQQMSPAKDRETNHCQNESLISESWVNESPMSEE